jgi:3-phenylpropionate/trans-cinnamate dioxygenase ferredoxin subunit
MGQFTKVATLDDVPAGSSHDVTLNGTPIAIFNIDGTLYAIDDTCPHEGGRLCDGWVENESVTCPLHAAIFSLRDGRTMQAPVGEELVPPVANGVRTHNVRVVGSDVEIEEPGS